MEIQRAGEWGTICDDDFTLQAAHVLCRELGFTEATGWTHSAKYGPGTGEQGSMCGRGIALMQGERTPGQAWEARTPETASVKYTHGGQPLLRPV